MRAKLLPSLAMLVALAGSVFAWQQWRTATALKARVAALDAEVQQKDAALDEQASIIARLRTQNEAYINESASLRERLASLRQVSPVIAEDSTVTSPSSNPLAESFRKFFGALKKNPFANEATRQKQTALVQKIYGDYASSRGLSAERAQQLFDLLVTKGMIQSEDGDNLMSGDGEKGENAGSNAQAAAQRIAEIDRQVQTLLGDASYADFQEYNKTGGERMVLSQIQRQFDANALTLSDQESASLLNVLLEERAKTTPSPLAPTDISPREQILNFLASKNQEQLYQTEDELNQRIVNRVGGILNPDQLGVLKAYLNQNLEGQKLMIEMARTTSDARTNAANGQQP